MTENTHRYKAVTSCAWSGFGAAPAGNRNNNGAQFYNRGIEAIYWSSSVGSSANAWRRGFGSGNAQVNRNLNSRSNGFSVRCVRESKGTGAKERFFFSKIHGK
ncbi:MAG: fibrobacter succinogenes major paralogous domain-containing protein [Prevotellaceae bacterium]|nr:fibrobacter succinogenes major paralogous domain-containing protein [Prevotellaceae bacterium]